MQPTKKLILRYNANVPGSDSNLPKITELAERFGLSLSIDEESGPGKKLKVLSVTGSEVALSKLKKEISRLPAVTVR